MAHQGGTGPAPAALASFVRGSLEKAEAWRHSMRGTVLVEVGIDYSVHTVVPRNLPGK